MENNILNILNEKGISINKLSKDLDLSYSYTHGLVNREDLNTIQAGTLLNIANYLDVDITKLYKGEGKMKTMFNQDLVKVLVRENGGNAEYDYGYFKEGFEEWAEEHDANLPGLEQLREYIIGSGYSIIEITEKDHLDELVDELKELIGEEFTLLEMDNEVQSILYEMDESGKSSIFDGETESFIEDGQHSYTIWADEEKDDTVDINVWFKVIEKNEDNFEILVEVTDIELL